MLRLGKMYTTTDEFNIFILENSSITRLEIGDSKSQWQYENSAILYGEYKRQSLWVFGDCSLAQLYRKTIENAKNMNCTQQIYSKWEKGFFLQEIVKHKSDNEYYSYIEKSGKFLSELCRHDGVTVEVYVFEEDCRLDLSPLNHEEYKRVKKCHKKPTQPNCADYDNSAYLAELFKDLFCTYVRQNINIDSDEAIYSLFYTKRNLPCLIKSRNGEGSVKPKAIRALAGEMKEVPSGAFSADIRDKNGKLVLRASVINNAKYPEAVFLNKYRYYAERAARNIKEKGDFKNAG